MQAAIKAATVNTRIFVREHFQKYCSRSAKTKMRAVFFGFVLAQLQGSFEPAPSPKADDRHRPPKVQAGLAFKNPRSERLQFFFNRSRDLMAILLVPSAGFYGQSGRVPNGRLNHG
jgi:hypothetical protein